MDKRYISLSSIPAGYRDYISKLVDDGVIKGTSDGKLDLSLDMIRTLIFCMRMLETYFEKEF